MVFGVGLGLENVERQRAENRPLPIPIVDRDGSWYFDCSLGRREILYRRIGENEMNTIDTLRGTFDAENQYYANSADAGTNAVEEYAQHFTCTKVNTTASSLQSGGSDKPWGNLQFPVCPQDSVRIFAVD